MSVVLTTRWPDTNPEGFDRLRRQVMGDGPLPETLRLQIAAADGEDLVTIEVWESAQAAEAFRTERLRLAAERVGLPTPPAATALEVHQILGPGGRPTARASRLVLVVANETLGSPALRDAMTRLAATGPVVFHLLVPVRVAGTAAADPETDLGDPLLQDELWARAWDQARQVLDEHVDRLRRQGIDATGEVGPGDPAAAVRLILGRRRFDEVILSTLPAGLSRWLGMDLPSRLRRMLNVPLTVVTADQAD